MLYERYSNRIRGKMENLNRIYSEMMYEKADSLQNVRGLETKEHLRLPPAEGLFALESGHKWGGEYMNLWVIGSYTVPESLAGKKLFVIPHTDAYETLFFKNGQPDGIFNSKGDFMGRMHSAQLLTDCAKPGDTFELAFECYAHHFVVDAGPYDAYGREIPKGGSFEKTYRSIDICVLNETVFQFVFDLETVLQMASVLRGDNFLKAKAQTAIEKVFANVIQYPALATPEDIESSLKLCLSYLAPCLEKNGADRSRGSVSIIGHSHMDTAWLWPVDETIRKCARTYANVCKLMEQYPDYMFVQSSALHSDWMRRYYPAVFDKIRKYVAKGRYEPNGGVWVECDCNITSGELMARQFMYGQLFTREYFGYTSDSFWLPDTFGYNAAIPQIMLESEVKYFYTTKMGWNDLNEFPMTSFIWRGIDGSEVITHLHNIDVQPNVKDIMAQVDYNKNKQNSDSKLLPFGHGDGGGGPTPALLEEAKRVTGVSGLCDVHYSSISDFMKELDKNREQLPVFSGELYLELHRGTLTQMHDIKRTNRKYEIALRDMDHMNVIAGSKKNERTDDLYKVLLQNQFHDILPGTCYTGVTQKAVSENLEGIKEAKKIAKDYAKELTDGSDSLALFNTTSFERSDVAAYEANGRYPKGIPSQTYTDVTGKKVTVFISPEIAPLGCSSVELTDAPADAQNAGFSFDPETGTVDTPFATAVFDELGGFAYFYDKEHDRVLGKKGASLNKLMIAEDVPNYWDNWDIDFETMTKLHENGKVERIELVSLGAVCMVLRAYHKVGRNSTLTQDIIFYANSPRVDFHTVIDWKEKHTLLKTSFDLDIVSSTVRNEIQFGHIDRPTTRNSSLEAAKFEVCNHKWSDLSESRFGAAILNDCKYGISAYNNDLCLTLHRGGTHPDVTGDEGVHEMTYSLFTHGAFSVGNVVKEAYLLNMPCLQANGRTKKNTPFIEISADNIVCEAIKPAALKEDAIVVRLYEAERCRTNCRVSVPEGYKKAYRVNFLEDIKEELEIENGEVELEFSPFRIISLMFER